MNSNDLKAVVTVDSVSDSYLSNKSVNTSPSTIKKWLISLSKVTAIYTLLIVRIGTQDDSYMVRKKAKQTRQKFISLALLSHSSLLPHFIRENFQKETIPQELLNLFIFYCSCIEYFVEQLLRTVDLLISFRLSQKCSKDDAFPSKSSFIYSGSSHQHRIPTADSSKLLSMDMSEQKLTCQTPNQSYFKKATLHSHVNIQSVKSLNHEEPSTLNDQLSQTWNTSWSTIRNIKSKSTNSQSLSHRYSTWYNKLKKKGKRHLNESIEYNSHPNSGNYDSSASMGEDYEYPSFISPDNPSNDSYTSQNRSDPELEEIGLLRNDIQVIRNLILEVYSKVPINPWAVKPLWKRRNNLKSCNKRNTDIDRKYLHYLNGADKISPNEQSDLEQLDYSESDYYEDSRSEYSDGSESLHQTKEPLTKSSQEGADSLEEDDKTSQVNRTQTSRFDTLSSQGNHCARFKDGFPATSTNYRQTITTQRRCIMITVVTFLCLTLLTGGSFIWLFVYSHRKSFN